MSEALKDNPEQEMICVDAFGGRTGRIIDRKTAHSTPGIKHLAIQVMVFNPQKELILHERPLKKVGGGVWDSPTTHVLNGETPSQAGVRCLKDEYGIASNEEEITVLGGFSYEKDYGDGSCENEFCLAAFAVYTGSIKPNGEHVIKLMNFPAKKVRDEIKAGSSKYPVWFVETTRIVAADFNGKKFFE